MTQLSAAELNVSLPQFTGTTQWYRYSPMFKQLLLTDGTRFLAEKAGAYWLMDAIGSHIFTNRRLSPQREPMQFWTFKRTGGGGDLIVTDGRTDRAIVKQEIPFSDFPLDEIKLYAAWDGGMDAFVLMLPSEY
jgi:uncharacterized protein DUF6876